VAFAISLLAIPTNFTEGDSAIAGSIARNAKEEQDITPKPKGLGVDGEWLMVDTDSRG
jgi:hypothetical protein